MNRSFSVLIPDGESEFALFAAHSLAQFPEVKLHVLSNKRWAPIRFSRYCKSYTAYAPNLDNDALLDVVRKTVTRHKIDILLPTETKWIAFAIENRAALEQFVALTPLPNPDAFVLANDKWQLALTLQEKGIPCPPTILATYDDDFFARLEETVFPVLLKPITAWGGEGIESFETLPPLKEYLAAHEPRLKNRYIVQTKLPGFVVGVNILSQQGRILATTMQRGTIPNTQKFAAAGGIKFIKEERFYEITERLSTALNWSGFANVDTLYDSNDDMLKILEINARFWGSLRGSLVAGVSFPYFACLAGLGIPFPLPDYNLVRYVHTKTAVRERVRRMIGKESDTDYSIQETGLKFLIEDPVAESVRAFQQEFMDEKST